LDDPGYNDKVSEVRIEMSATWQPQHRHVPLASWRSRADVIEAEPDDLRSLARYHALRRDMEYLEETVGEYAAGLDQHIQMEIDRMRGK
jgi:hypothetical protein